MALRAVSCRFTISPCHSALRVLCASPPQVSLNFLIVTQAFKIQTDLFLLANPRPSTHRFLKLVRSYTYKSLFQQLFCFLIYTKPRGVTPYLNSKGKPQ